jgi:uncharacterized protein (TIGR02266 family)
MEQKPPNLPRAPINLRIKFRSDTVEQFIERYSVDVSRGGIFIRTKEPLPVGTQLRLDFQFQNGGALMAGDGTVVWIREFDPNRVSVPPGMGVRFDKLTPESQAVLEQLLAEKAKRERGAVPGSGAGGLAVRRPSSMFSALEPQVLVTDRSQAEKPDPGNQSGPSQPSATPPSSAEDSQKQEASAHRPVGPARNPFSSPPATSPASPVFGKSPGTRPAQRHTPADGSATFDDMNDEPTQIAGRFPAFLATDDEPTRAVQLDRESQNRESARESVNDLRKETPLEPIEAGARRHDDSLDAIFPVTSSSPPVQATSPPLPAAALDSDAHPSVSEPNATPSAKQTEPPTTTAERASALDGPVLGAGPGPIGSNQPSMTQAAESRKAAKRKSPAAIVGLTVIVLGAAAIFIARFFGSQATETISPASTPAGNTATVGPPGPPPAPAADPAPAVPATPPAAVAPEIPPPAASAPPPAVGTPPAEPQNDMPVAAPTTAKSGRPPSNSAAQPPVGEEQADDSGPGAIHKAAKRKPARAVREPSAAETPSQEAKPIEPAPAAAVSTTGPEGQPAATTSAGEVEMDSHQIRITSRPAGADVSLDGQSVGKTPFSVGIADVSAPHFVAVRKDGFEPFEQMISASSAWSKTKATKGKSVVQVLKINAKLKQIGGDTEVKTEPGPAAVPGDGNPKTEVVKPERPSLPPGERAPSGSPP